MDLSKEDILLIKTLLVIEMKELELYLLKNRYKSISPDELNKYESLLERTELLFDKFDEIKF